MHRRSLANEIMAITKATKQLQGRLIGFIGDCTVSHKPTLVLFPSQKTWQWVTENISTEGPDLLNHYAMDASRGGSLWTPANNCDGVETTVPHLLHIPLVLFAAIREKGGPLLPHEILAILLKLVETAPRTRTRQQQQMHGNS